MLTPATDIGRVGVAAYAQRAGIGVEAFQDQLGPVLTTEHLAKTIADVVTDESYSEAANSLTATELSPPYMSFALSHFGSEVVLYSPSQYSVGRPSERRKAGVPSISQEEK
jgi:hypothetical protein